MYNDLKPNWGTTMRPYTATDRLILKIAIDLRSSSDLAWEVIEASDPVNDLDKIEDLAEDLRGSSNLATNLFNNLASDLAKNTGD